ncbi:hypothetical protein JKY79_01505 [Candidatus Babeliales bacterium]|nr:hypothetical protein [Candidatus Babeliales bacterium]
MFDLAEPSNKKNKSSSSSSSSSMPSTPPPSRTIFHKTPQKAIFGTTISHDLIESLSEILKNKENLQNNSVEIYVNSFFFTNGKLAQALVNLKKKIGRESDHCYFNR